jgi:peptidoglycan/LPS O-acetylase OafA/YrhL
MSAAALATKPPAHGSGKIPSLDGVRAVSFLIVFIAHAGLDHIVPGRFGVAVFFLLSGYLITTLMIREREKTGWISLKLFYMRRALRIFPPMYAIFGATVIFLWFTHQLVGVTTGGVCSQLFYYQNYYFHGGIIPGLGPLWSLAVEEHFYLFFPPLMLLLLARLKNYQQIALSLLAFCGVILVWRCCVVALMPHGLQWARDASDTRADSILFGCVLACLQQTPACEQMFERKRLERYIVPGCLAILLITFAIRNPIFRETLRYTLQAVAIGPLLYYVIRYPETRIGRLLNTSLLSYLGILSYSLYLIHASVLVQMQRWMHSKIAAGVLGLFICIALAFITRTVIEKPTEKLRGKLRHRNASGPYARRREQEREFSAT